MRTTQLYLLGDVFEAWAGDDDIATPFHRNIVTQIRAVSDANIDVFWIAGNRDFLVGDVFARAAGLTRLDDPTVVSIAGRQLVLAHGDAQCTDDQAYMQFRAQVREPEWQKTFLAMPLAQRKAIIEGMRTGSREAQLGKSNDIMDVNGDAIARLFDASGTDTMIHGHTHRPARHDYGAGDSLRTRYVLPDWDCDADIARGGWIAIIDDGRIMRVALDGSTIDW